MRQKRWFRPVVAVAASIAVAASAALVGIQFAPRASTITAPQTRDVPVLAPVAYGDSPELTTQAGEPILSEVIDEREVMVPSEDMAGDSAGTNLTVEAIVDALAESDDPGEELAELLDFEGDTGSDGSAAGDPCAPREGEPEDDCPDGLHSTVLALERLLELRIQAYPFPPAVRETPTGFNPVWCDYPSPEPGTVPFSAVSNVPGEFGFTIWPMGHPDDVRVLPSMATSAEDSAAFFAEKAAHPDDDYYSLLLHCILVDGLAPDTVYEGMLDFIDVHGRPAHRAFWFSSAGAPVRQGASIFPIGEGMIVVDSLYGAGEGVSTSVYRIPEGESAPPCSALLGLTAFETSQIEVEATGTLTGPVRPDRLKERNVPLFYGHEQFDFFELPEGSTSLVCVRWFPEDDLPSWQDNQPTYTSSAVVQAPDRLLPNVWLESYTGADERYVGGTAFADSVEGHSCGYSAPVRRGVYPRPLCRPSVDDYYWGVNPAFGGDWVATFWGHFSYNGVDVGTSVSALLPAPDAARCRGVCAPTTKFWYTVEVPDGEFTHDCSLLTGRGCADTCDVDTGRGCTDEITVLEGGTLTLSVSWEQALHNGRSDWNITGVVSSAPEYELPDLPQLNTDNLFSLVDPDAAQPSLSASIVLEADRPVDYVLQLHELDDDLPAFRCIELGVLEQRGSITGPTTVVIPDLCRGTTYRASVELVDAEGHRSVWGNSDSRTLWWNRIIVPGFPVTVHYAIDAEHVPETYVRQFLIGIGEDHPIDRVDVEDGRCDSDGMIRSVGAFHADVAAYSKLRFVYQFDTGYTVSADGWCEAAADSLKYPASVVEVPLSFADLVGEGRRELRFDLPDFYDLHLRVWVN